MSHLRKLWSQLSRAAKIWFCVCALILVGLFQMGWDHGYDRPDRSFNRHFRMHWGTNFLEASFGSILDAVHRHYDKGHEERLYLQYANLFLGKPMDKFWFLTYRGDLGAYNDLFVPDLVSPGPRLPYRDLALEYPPVNIPFIVAPRLFSDQPFDYYTLYGLEMALLALGTLLIGVWIAVEILDYPPQRVTNILKFSALGLLAMGSIVTTRLDLILSFFLVAAVAAVLSSRPLLAGSALALACGAKLFPVLLVPLFVCHLWRSDGSRKAWSFCLTWAAVTAAIFLPAALLGGERFWAMFWFHGGRPIQVESVYSGYLLLHSTLFGSGSSIQHFQGSFNLVTPWNPAFRLFSTVATVVSGPLMALLYWRATRSGTLARAFLRSVVGFLLILMAVSKVLSPQYLIWIWPLGFLIGSDRNKGYHSLLLLSMLGTQLVFPTFYGELVRGEGAFPVWLLAGRNTLLIAATWLTVRGLRDTDDPV